MAIAPIVFPSTLPGPSVATITPAERRLVSDLPGPENVASVQRDYLAQQQLTWSLLDATAAAALQDFWKTACSYGGAWFTATWPTPQGWQTAVRRFTGAPKWQALAGGFWSMTTACEIRGAGLAPQNYPGKMVLDMRFHGANGATSPFVDECGHSVANLGGVAFTTAQLLYGPSSGAFGGGSTSVLDIASSTDFDIGTGDFEMGCRAMYTSGRNMLMNRRFYDNTGPGAWAMNFTGFVSVTGVGDIILNFGTQSTGTWDEYVVSRQSGTTYALKNGVLVDSAADTHSYSSTYDIRMGDYNDHIFTGNMVGFIAEAWLIVGGCRHIASYTPTTAEIARH